MSKSDTTVIGPFRVQTTLANKLKQIVKERSKDPETRITLNRIAEIALSKYVQDATRPK